jgi:hypothetical protein
VPDLAIENNHEVAVSRSLGLRVLSIVLKSLIGIAALGFIYHEVIHKQGIAEIQALASTVLDDYLDMAIVTLVVFMMFVNWTLESLKWKFLINKIEKISVFRSVRAIFSGTSISVFTPNRIGDFGARVFYLDHCGRIKAVFITLVGSISQFVVTILIGLLAISVYLVTMYPGAIDPVLGYAIFGVLGLSTSLTVACYYNVSAITNWGKRAFRSFTFLRRPKIQKQLKGYIDVFSLYSTRELSLTLGYSFLRYIVFSAQFYLLLIVFNVDIALISAFALIALTFFTMAVIPTVALTELGVRGSVALYFLSQVSENSAGIITATFVLWIINLALPAIIGSVFVFSANIFKEAELS